MKRICLILITGITLSCSNYQEYRPQVFNGNSVVVKPDLMTKEHEQNLIQVLEFYEIDWKKENAKIYISSDIDKEIMWNFTTKANDPEWLRTHKPDTTSR